MPDNLTDISTKNNLNEINSTLTIEEALARYKIKTTDSPINLTFIHDQFSEIYNN